MKYICYVLENSLTCIDEVLKHYLAALIMIHNYFFSLFGSHLGLFTYLNSTRDLNWNVSTTIVYWRLHYIVFENVSLGFRAPKVPWPSWSRNRELREGGRYWVVERANSARWANLNNSNLVLTTFFHLLFV